MCWGFCGRGRWMDDFLKLNYFFCIQLFNYHQSMNSRIFSLIVCLLVNQSGFTQQTINDSLDRAGIYKLIRPTLERINELQFSDTGFMHKLPMWGVFAVYVTGKNSATDSVAWNSNQPELSTVFAEMKKELVKHQWNFLTSTTSQPGNNKRLVILPIMILANAPDQQRLFSLSSFIGLIGSQQLYEPYLFEPFEIYVFDPMNKTAAVGGF